MCFTWYLLADGAVRNVLVFDARFASVVDKHRHDMASVEHFVAVSAGAPAWATPYAELTRGSEREPTLDVDENAPCFIQPTTGTTGDPKPWTATHHS
jgi:acyl-coenzyme A synthetase/AMP-(fatty) acid ligase